MAKMRVELEESDWDYVQLALHQYAGEIAAMEARRTGGMGFSSGGRERTVAKCHEIREVIRKVRDDGEKLHKSERGSTSGSNSSSS